MNNSAPLAERMRPKSLDEYKGQDHLLKKGASLRMNLDAGMIPSMILWGPPGVGKTTLAHLITNHLKRPFHTLSAISSGVKDVREVIQKVEKAGMFQQSGTILFIDEMHTLIGAGKADGAMDAANMIKPALARGELHCIGATTLNEYRQYVEKDAALARRFQPLMVSEPTLEDTVSILRGIKEKYELLKVVYTRADKYEGDIAISSHKLNKA